MQGKGKAKGKTKEKGKQPEEQPQINGLKRDLNLSSFHALGKVLYCKRGNGEAEGAHRDDMATGSQRQYVLALSTLLLTFNLAPTKPSPHHLCGDVAAYVIEHQSLVTSKSGQCHWQKQAAGGAHKFSQSIS